MNGSVQPSFSSPESGQDKRKYSVEKEKIANYSENEKSDMIEREIKVSLQVPPSLLESRIYCFKSS